MGLGGIVWDWVGWDEVEWSEIGLGGSSGMG